MSNQEKIKKLQSLFATKYEMSYDTVPTETGIHKWHDTIQKYINQGVEKEEAGKKSAIEVFGNSNVFVNKKQIVNSKTLIETKGFTMISIQAILDEINSL